LLYDYEGTELNGEMIIRGGHSLDASAKVYIFGTYSRRPTI
jgi:hypothetical protein